MSSLAEELLAKIPEQRERWLAEIQKSQAAVALAMAETGHFLRDGEMQTLAADKGSAELPYLARSKYDGTAYSMTLEIEEDAGEEVAAEVSDFPATLTISNANDQVVYRKSGIAQCGV